MVVIGDHFTRFVGQRNYPQDTYTRPEIDKLYFECKEEGRDIELTSPLYVHLAWFAYEEIIRRIGQDLGIDV